MFTGQITAEAVIADMLTRTPQPLKKYTRSGTISVTDEGLAWEMRKGLRKVRSTAGWDRFRGFMRQGDTAKILLDGSDELNPAFNTAMVFLTFVSTQAEDLEAAFRSQIPTGWKMDWTSKKGIHWDSFWGLTR